MDENFIRPQAMVGPVIMNGAVHQNLCNLARREKNPYYKQAANVHSNNQNKIKHGDIVFTLTRPCAALGSGQNANNANRLQGAAILNGHGKDTGRDNDNEIFMESVSILGIAEVPIGAAPNAQGYFNIIRGGILTVLNNSKWTIQVGDYVMAYAPKRSEIQDGGAGKEADKAGEATLWFKTYDPQQNSLTPKPIWQALTDDENAGHLPQYLATCKSLFNSVKDMSLTVMASCYDELKTAAAASTSPGAFMTTMEKIVDDKKRERKLIDDLFVLYSGAQPIDPSKANNKGINKRQREGLGQFLTQSALLHHYVHKNVIGQAMSTADPRHNFSLQLTNYGR
jgi:hypothetical protein